MSDDLIKRLRIRGAQERERSNHYVRRMEVERLEAATALAEAQGTIARLTARAGRMKAALQWCSGSDDFQEGGKARAGWLKICAPLLHPAALTDKPDAGEG